MNSVKINEHKCAPGKCEFLKKSVTLSFFIKIIIDIIYLQAGTDYYYNGFIIAIVMISAINIIDF